MVSKNNIQHKLEADAKRVPHYSLRKLSFGVASVLLGTTLYFGAGNVAHADTVSGSQVADANTQSAQVTSGAAQSGVQPGAQATGQQSGAQATSQQASSVVSAVQATSQQASSAVSAVQATSQQASSAVSAVQAQPNAEQTTSVGVQQNSAADSLALLSAEQSANAGQVQPGFNPLVLTIVGDRPAASDVTWDASKDTELQKDVVEIIGIIRPDGRITSEQQTVHFTRTKKADGSFSDWSTDGNSTMPQYELPQFKGYTAYDANGGAAVSSDGKYVVPVHVTGNMSNFAVKVDYRADQQYVQVQYVDENGNIVATQDLSGIEGSVVHRDPSVLPIGYQIKDANVPDSWTITAGMINPKIQVQAQKIKISHTDGRNITDKIPGTAQGDQPAWNFPAGLSNADLNRDVTRTINVKDANGKVTPITQVVHFHRDATLNVATFEIDYDQWKSDENPSWAAYDVDVPAGQDMYIDGVLSSDHKVNAQDVSAYTVDVTTNVVLEKQQKTVGIIYYDAGQAGQNPSQDAKDNATVAQGEYTGYVGDSIDPSKIDNGGLDQGYTPDYSGATSYVLTDGDSQVIYVPVNAKKLTVNHDQPKNPGDAISGNDDDTYPDGVKASDLNQTITRTINVTVPNGHGKNQTVTQVAKIHRDATVNVVTGVVTYTDWTTDGTNWTDFKPAAIDGYTVSQADVPAVTVKDGQTGQTVDITYTAKDQTTHIIYVDGDDHPVKSYEISGKTDQTVDTNATIPTGWVLSHGQTPAPSTITFAGASTPDTKITVEHGTRHVDHTTPDQPGTKTPTGKAVTGTQASDLNQTITRTVNITEPGQKMATTTQTAKIYRDATVDEVTGEVTYGDWSTDATDWTAVDVPSHAGYTTHISNGTDSIPAVTVKDGQQSETIAVTYTANAQAGKIVYVDVDNQNVEVGHTDLTGNTDQDVTITPKAPAGYDIVSGQNIPSTEKATADGIPTVTVKVNHHKITVNPGDEPKPGDKIPGNPNKQPGDGTPKTDVSYETLHRNMTRTVNVTDPHTGLHPTTVVLHYNRTATIDDVTGEVTYSNWTVVDGSQAGFDAFNIPTVAGYTSEIKSGSAEDLKAFTPSQDQITNWSDQTVNIDYTANDQTMHITYVDKDGHPVDGGSFTVTGKTDQTVTTNAKIPTGWVLSQGQTDAPKTVTFGGTPTADVTVKIEHGTKHVDHNDPVKSGDKTPTNKLINGAHDEDLNRTVTRTINVHTPDGKVTPISQVAKIFRDATVDEVTGDVSYGAWSTDATDWVAYTAPSVDGYTPDKSVDLVTVNENTKDATIDINYNANDQSIIANFVDQDGHMVATKTIAGHTGETVDVANFLPDGWTIYRGQRVPTKVTFGAHNNNCDFVVSHLMVFVPSDASVTTGDLIDGTTSKHYPEGATESNLNKTVTRTINVTMPSGAKKTVTQSVQFVRNAVVDAVTGQVNYLGWSENGSHVLTGYVPQPVDGYMVSEVKNVTVTPETADQTVDVTYTAVPKTITINYKTADGKVVSTVTDVTADKDGNITLTAPAGYVLSTNVDKVKLADLKDNVYDATVRNDSHVVTVDDANLPATVSKDNLKKTVSRTITITMPNGKARTIKQNVTFVRTANVDSKGALLGYNEWQATGRAQFNGVFIPKYAGYTLKITKTGSSSSQSLDKIAKMAVTPDTANDTIMVSYVKN